MNSPDSGGPADRVSEDGPGASSGTAGAIDLPDWVRDILRCPVTGATLVDGVGPDGEPELHSTVATRRLAYPVRDGIPVLLAEEARAR